MTVPRQANSEKAARLEAKFTTLALPEARVRVSPKTVVKATTRSEPVPGPKKPS